MKSIILFLSLLACTIVSSQDIYYVDEVRVGTYSSYKGWSWETHETFLQITMHGRVLMVDDDAKSSYRVITDAKKTYKTDREMTEWMAIDEKNRRCSLIFTKWKPSGNFEIFVMYDDITFGYHVSSKQ